MVATDLILVETVEHLGYAIKQIGGGGRKVSATRLFEVAQGSGWADKCVYEWLLQDIVTRQSS